MDLADCHPDMVDSGQSQIVFMSQIGDTLSDAPDPSMEYAMRQESEQIVRVGQRIASCMAK